MEKEIWTIDDIIKDYENKGLAGRSKVEFLNIVKDFILKNTKYIQLAPIIAEENEKVIKEIEEKMKDKNFCSIDYTNPGLTINPIYMPKKYLKWEDLKFERVSPEFPRGIVTYNVKMGNTPLKLFCQYGSDKIHHYVEIYRPINDKLYFFTSMYDDETDEEYNLEPQLFNDLHLEVID